MTRQRVHSGPLAGHLAPRYARAPTVGPGPSGPAPAGPRLLVGEGPCGKPHYLYLSTAATEASTAAALALSGSALRGNPWRIAHAAPAPSP